jgi:hypothetical protein
MFKYWCALAGGEVGDNIPMVVVERRLTQRFADFRLLGATSVITFGAVPR